MRLRLTILGALLVSSLVTTATGDGFFNGLFMWGLPIAIILIGVGNRRDKELWPVPQAAMGVGVFMCLINVIGLLV